MNSKNSYCIPATEPTVTVVWSESNHLYDGQVMPLSRANDVFRTLDDAKRKERVKPGYGQFLDYPNPLSGGRRP